MILTARVAIWMAVEEAIKTETMLEMGVGARTVAKTPVVAMASAIATASTHNGLTL